MKLFDLTSQLLQLENSYEADFTLTSITETDDWRKYELQGRGGYLTLQIVATIPE